MLDLKVDQSLKKAINLSPCNGPAAATMEPFYCFSLLKRFWPKSSSGFTLNYPPALKVQMGPRKPFHCDQVDCLLSETNTQEKDKNGHLMFPAERP